MADEDKNSCVSRELLKNAAPIMFGLIIIGGFFYIIYMLLNHEYPGANKDQLSALIEFLKSIVILVVGFFFGSSASNKTKDETISDIAKMTPAPIAPIAPVAPVAPVAPIAPVAPVAPITVNIPNATEVKAQTQEGDVNLQPKPPESTP